MHDYFVSIGKKSVEVRRQNEKKFRADMQKASRLGVEQKRQGLFRRYYDFWTSYPECPKKEKKLKELKKNKNYKKFFK